MMSKSKSFMHGPSGGGGGAEGPMMPAFNPAAIQLKKAPGKDARMHFYF